MKFFFASALAEAALVAGVLAATIPPSKVLQARATTFTGQYDSVATGSYTVYQNLWGKDKGTGSQTTTVDGLSGSDLSWSTSWTWSGGSSDVKSYANAGAKIDVVQVSSVSGITTTWDWSYNGTDVVANVAYDLFTSSTSTGSNEYEVMIWLTALGGAGPISSTGSAIATTTINGVSWSLYYGLNGSMKVYSFVASSAQKSFTGDLTDFLTYLVNSQSFPNTQYLLSVQAGTEAFTGSSAVFTVSTYSLSFTTGTATGTTNANAAATTNTAATAAKSTTKATTAITGTTKATSAQATSSKVTSAQVTSSKATSAKATSTKAASSKAGSKTGSTAAVTKATTAAKTATSACPAAVTITTTIEAASLSSKIAVAKAFTSTTTDDTAATSTSTSSSTSVAGQYEQCGGTGFTGATTCAGSYTCTYMNDYYSQCV